MKQEIQGERPTPSPVLARAFAALLLLLLLLPVKAQQAPRLIEVLAGHDSRYKIEGMSKPSITVTANEKYFSA
jgi:hypothetical protein